MEILGGALVLAMLIFVVWMAMGAPGKGRKSSDSGAWIGNKQTPGLFTTWLALCGATLLYLEVAANYQLPSGLVVAGILSAVIGLHVARWIVEPTLALAGVAAVTLQIYREFGASTAILVILVVVLVTWISGAVGIFTGRRFGG